MERGNDGVRDRPLRRNLVMHSKPGAFGAVRQSHPKKAKESGYPADARTERYVSRAFGRPAIGGIAKRMRRLPYIARGIP